MEQPEKFPGIGVAPEPARTYPAPAGANAAHLLGWVARAGADDVESGDGAIDDEDVVGRSGLEAQYDAELRGRNGATVVAIDPRGVVTDTLSSRNPVPGSDVVTHLDARLQARTEAVLAADGRARPRRRSACRCGGGRRPRRHQRGRRRGGQPPGIRPRGLHRRHQQRRARGAGRREPRRPAEVADHERDLPAGLDVQGDLRARGGRLGASLDGTYDCSPSLTVGGRVFKNFESRGYGRIDLHRALVVSCDTVFYRLAYAAWQAQGGIERPPGRRPLRGDRSRLRHRPRHRGRPAGESAGRLPDRAWKEQYWAATRAATCRGRGRLPRGGAHRPGPGGLPDASSPSRTARAAASTARVTPSTSRSARATSPSPRCRWRRSMPRSPTAARCGSRRSRRRTLPGGHDRRRSRPGAPGRCGVRADVLAYVRAALGDVTRPGGSAGGRLRRLPAGPLPGGRQDRHRRGLRQAGDRVVRRVRADDHGRSTPSWSSSARAARARRWPPPRCARSSMPSCP